MKTTGCGMNFKVIIIFLVLPYQPKKKDLSVFGGNDIRYLRECQKGTYTSLLTSSRLNSYLADIDRQAQERFETLTEQMKHAQGITEQLKAENALEWTDRMNNIRACAMEIVNSELIYN